MKQLNETDTSRVNAAFDARRKNVSEKDFEEVLDREEEFNEKGSKLGDGTIAELDGNGNYRAISLEHFIHGDEGEHWRTGSFAYAACDSNGNALGSEKVAACARAFLGKKTNYTLDANNCHRFSAACHNGGNEENVWRALETFSIGKLLAHVRALHNLKKISWRPIGGERRL